MVPNLLTSITLLLSLLGPYIWQPLAIQAVNYFEKGGMYGEGKVLLGLASAFLYYFLLDLVPLMFSFQIWKFCWPWGRWRATGVSFLAYGAAQGYAYAVTGEKPAWLPVVLVWVWSWALQRVILLEQENPPQTAIFLLPLSTAAIEWLRFWPLWPQGELARALVETSVFLGEAPAISLILLSLSGLSVLLVMVATQLQTIYFYNYRTAIQAGQEHLRWLELRNLQEMHTLVHDLKTPLTTIAGLNSLIGLMTMQGQIREYSEKVAQAVDHASAMVSEILAADKRTSITVKELVNYIRAHVLPRYTGQTVIFELEGLEQELTINHIRVTRAIINLLENAFEATAKQSVAEIKFSTRVIGDWLEICIEDNGPGIEPELLENIWEWGFSTKQQPSGLGLFFVRQVVEQHQGKIEINSHPGFGTEVKIMLPLEQESANR